ncbi:MAG TPA: alpha/beta hydrolase [Lacibacter sp.]|nr:alpha/beta hydrolase [Lacibacter sp.]HMO88928.1 alpha/beta hydrolase [Lacibacter sp.]
MGNSSNIFDFVDNLFMLSSQTKSKIYVINYRGYGKSKGTPSFSTQFSGNSLITNEIIQKQNKLDFIIGFSLGSVFASYSALESKTDALYLLAPFSNTKELFKYFKKQNTRGIKALFRPFIKFSADDYLLNVSNTEKIKSYKGKLIIMHGNADKQLPYFMGQSLYKKSISLDKELITIDNGEHWSPMLQANWKMLINKIK